MKRSASESANRTSRRRLLGASAVAATVGLAGCIEEMGSEFPQNTEWPVSELVPDLPVRERIEIVEERIHELAGKDIAGPDELVAVLEEYDLAVESIERDRDVLALEYVNTDRTDEGDLHDVGLLAGGYAALIGGGYEAAALGATILDDAPASYGSATVETQWAVEYNQGGLTAAEYGEYVAGTIESQRYEPEVGVDPEE
ncbi:hypothetical protein [Haloterrigena salinisoli]|uniref:hypothetical protein n=1 Tax=Haloterrigena salinisoli TaxID=3132747 RepID=UPI0030D192CB